MPAIVSQLVRAPRVGDRQPMRYAAAGSAHTVSQRVHRGAEQALLRIQVQLAIHLPFAPLVLVGDLNVGLLHRHRGSAVRQPSVLCLGQLCHLQILPDPFDLHRKMERATMRGAVGRPYTEDRVVAYGAQVLRTQSAQQPWSGKDVAKSHLNEGRQGGILVRLQLGRDALEIHLERSPVDVEEVLWDERAGPGKVRAHSRELGQVRHHPQAHLLLVRPQRRPRSSGFSICVTGRSGQRRRTRAHEPLQSADGAALQAPCPRHVGGGVHGHDVTAAGGTARAAVPRRRGAGLLAALLCEG
eukprot:scaffold6678_cov336-Prasinococcus_capsulatus_cf.AAC.6